MNSNEALKKSLAWFRTSGVMPENGRRGVAERIVCTENNAALDEIRAHFSNITEYPGYWIAEHRRPDCCFETALLFLLAAGKLGDPGLFETGKNLLGYLFRDSGLRRGELWNWYTPLDHDEFWFDDNGWIAAMELFIGQRFPALAQEFPLIENGRAAALRLGKAMLQDLDSPAPICHGKWPDPFFLGEVRQPHWGTPVCTALLLAGETDMVREYHEKLIPRLENFGTSEWAYALISSGIGARMNDPFLAGEAGRIAAKLAARADAQGILPSEHCEAPRGSRLVDLIYTVNWYLLGLAAAPGNGKPFSALRDYLISIQNPDGSWRGMFDAGKNAWGGGNCYEGGADSVYTGWTNAVIALAMLV